MKKAFICFILAWSSWTAFGQSQTTTTVPSPTPYSIISRSGNSRVWERTMYEVSPSGQVIPHMHHYTELAGGLCYQQNGQWVDSQEQINIQPDGTASATAGQHQVYFPADIGNGIIKMVTPDGLTLQSQPVGLSLDDGTNTVLIAALTNSVGELISPNQILYTNAFAGLDADLLYTYTKAGFEQDVILDEQPQGPESYGLNLQTARLELLTEFLNPPPPTVTTASLPEQAGLALTDDTLDFGLMKMIPGRAFLLGPSAQAGQVMVGKQWLTLEGRQFLVEAVPVAAIEDQLSQLPMAQTSSINRASPLNIVSAKRLLPARRFAKNTHARVMRVAQTGTRAHAPARGMLLDYQTVNSSQTNTVFQGDTTYYISGTVNLFGTNTFEGGTVLKYATNGCIVQNSGGIKWLADACRPVILTAKDDNTAGDFVSGSTGSPTNYYANPEALEISEVSTSSISYFRVSWAAQAFNMYASDWVNLQNGQLVNCGNGINAQYNVSDLGNMLFANIGQALSFNYGTVEAQNVTFSESTNLLTGNSLQAGFENCIFANVTSLTNNATSAAFSGDVNGFYDSPEFGIGPVTNTFYPFQTKGAGSYYLTNGCNFRGKGTTGIDADLLAELTQKTTYPPAVYDASNFTSATTLGPDVARDTNASPDLGYHYDPLDYVIGGCDLDTNLTFTPGTAVGWFEDNGSDGGPYAISLDDGATLSLNGTATQPGDFVRFTMVQEAVNGHWTDRSYIGGVMLNGSGALPYPQLSGNFTKFIVDADAGIGRDDWASGVFAFQNCELYNGNLTAYAMQNVYFTNSLFFRVFAAFYDQDYAISFNIENCTFYNGFLGAGRWSGQSGDTTSSWQIENTSFDGTDFSWTDNYNGSTHTLFNYNAYNTNNLSWTNYPFPYTPDCGTNEVTGPNDLMVTNYNWQTNWFGNFYLPTNSPLIRKGSTNASLLGLYHFTTQTNQAIEGTNIVTIGYHYVATDTNGDPLDSNGDGIPDYLEDPLGNGLPYNGTNWALAILVQPTNQLVALSSNVTLSVTAGGVPYLAYQWYFNSSLLANQTNTTLNLPDIQTNDAGNYQVVVTNNFGSVTSSVAAISVVVPPLILTQPSDVTLNLTSNATYSVSVSTNFASPLSFQWFWDGSSIGGATNAVLTVPNAQATNVGFYSLLVTNIAGAVTSSNAWLTITMFDSDFTNSTAIMINSNGTFTNTSQDGRVLEMTPATNDQAASAFTVMPICLVSNASFSAFFSFRLSNGNGQNTGVSDGHTGADGITFTLQTLTNNCVGGDGGGLGYVTMTDSVAIVFDTWYNTEGPFDPLLTNSQTILITTNANGTTGDGNHIGVVYNGYLTNAATFKYGIESNYFNAVAQHVMDDMNDSNIWYCWIDYNGANSNLEIRLSETNSTRPFAPTLTNIFNLVDFLGTTNSYVGFTAGTGGAFNQQDLLTWEFTSPCHPIGLTNLPPLPVQIISPINQTNLAWTNIIITATNESPSVGVPISYVKFFDNSNGSSNYISYCMCTNNAHQVLYQVNWLPATSYEHILTALTVGVDGSSALSFPVTNYIRALPSVAVTNPAYGEIFQEPVANIAISATASTSVGGTITQMILFVDTNNVWTTNTSSLTFIWTNVADGTYILHAQATDSYGGTGSSSNIVITVEPTNRPPFVYAGSNQTNYLSANPVQLNGIVSDDGLPLNTALTITWTNLSGPPGVLFTDSNAPVTEVNFHTPGTNILQLSACDTEFTETSDVTIVTLPTNPPPIVFAGPPQTVLLPTLSTNLTGILTATQIVNLNLPTGIDYYPQSNSVIVSINYAKEGDPNGGNPYNFELIDSNANTYPFSTNTLNNLQDEVYISTVRNSIGGFNPGEMFTGNGVTGEVMRIESDGTTIGNIPWTNSATGVIHSNAWLILSNGIVGWDPGLLRGGLWVDRTGVWGGDLIAVTETGDLNISGYLQVGDVWRANSSGQATLIARIPGGDTFEGVTTIPNNPQQYGPWAGHILVGGDNHGSFFAIDTNGFVVQYDFPFGAEDIRVIPQNENLFGCDQSDTTVGGLYGIQANQFTGMSGDILVADEGTDGDGAQLYRIRWNGSTFEVYPSLNLNSGNPSEWEGINFAPSGLLSFPPANWTQLNGLVVDTNVTINTWNMISGPTNAQIEFSDPTLTNTTVNFTEPGTYVLQLTASDGEYMESSNVTIQVYQIQAPYVNAGTNQSTSANIVNLDGVVTNSNPSLYSQTNVLWTEISGPGSVSITHSNVLTNSITLGGGYGNYALLLTADNGMATNSAEVVIDYLAPTNIVLAPGYSITSTNAACVFEVGLFDANENAISNTEVDIQFLSGSANSGQSPYNPYPASFTNVTSRAGYAVFSYTNVSSSLGSDIIQGETTNYSGVIVLGTNLWGQTLDCGDADLNQKIGSVVSIDPWSDGTHYANYYVLECNSNETIQLGLNNDDANNPYPLIMFLRGPSNNVVAASQPTQSINDNDGQDNNQTLYGASLDYTTPASGQYSVEVTTVDVLNNDDPKFDLFLSCGNGPTNLAPNLEVLFNGTNVQNGGTVVFPMTSQGVATNISLVLTNEGNTQFVISDFATNGDFELTNNIFNMSIPAGGSTNLDVIFNASSNGISFGCLVLADAYAMGSNYVVYFMGNTMPTSAVPMIQLTYPPNGSTYLINNNISIPFTAVTTGGSANISGVSLDFVTTNGLSFISPCTNFSGGGPDVWTNELLSTEYNWYQLTGETNITFTAVVGDANYQSNTAPPIVIHLYPYYSLDPNESPQFQLLVNGTNIPSGGTISFPQTSLYAPTSVSVIITNGGNYPLGFSGVGLVGDFTLTNDLTSATVLAGTSTNFEITFNASSNGVSFGQLVLSNNASAGGVYAATLIGSTLPPNRVQSVSVLPFATNETFTVLANSTGNILYPLFFDQAFDTNTLTITALDTSTTTGIATIINNGRAISYTPQPGYRSVIQNGTAYPEDGFNYEISDAAGNTSWGTISMIVYATDTPSVILSAVSYMTNAGNLDPITASLDTSTNVVSVDFYLDNIEIGMVTNATDGTNYVLDWTNVDDGFGGDIITASATDRFGQIGVASSITITSTPPVGVSSPVAYLNSYVGMNDTNGPQVLTNFVTIRDGVFNIYGQAYQPQGSNVVWQLSAYSSDGTTLIRNLTTGTNTAGWIGSSNLLTTCDLSTLQNGVYQLVLSVTSDYVETDTSVEIILESNVKLGQFSFSQQDLVIPVNGIPLTVTRSYNSINPTKGDFGYGWTYTLDNLNASLDESRKDKVDLDGNVFSERIGGGYDMTLTLPNGQVTTFAFYLQLGGLGTYQAMWQSAPGVTAQLALQNDADGQIETLFSSLTADTIPPYWDADPETPYQNYDFPSFLLKMQDGTKYYIARQDLDDHTLLNGTAEGADVQAYGDCSLSQVVEPNGDTISITPSSIDCVASNGMVLKQIEIQRNADNLITSISDPNAITNNGPPALVYQYDSQDNLIAVEQLVNAEVGTYVTNTFVYTNANFPHYITGIINANGSQVAKNFYDNSGKLIAVEDASGNITQFGYSISNNTETVIDRMGNTNSYVYDAHGNVIIQTNALGQITTMAYDDSNNKTNEVTYLNGQPYATNSYVYSTNDLMLASTDPFGNTSTYTYDQYANLLISTDARGNSTTNTYDSNNNLIMTSDALGDTNENYYNGDKLEYSVDQIGTITTNTYDQFENLIASYTLDVSGVILSSNTSTYDANGNRLTSTAWRQVNGNWTPATTTNNYDAMNRVIETINPDGGTNTITYNATGQQQATTNALGNTTRYTYDDENRLIQTTYPDGTTTSSSYDANGNRVTSTDQEGRVTTYVYDALNRLGTTIYPDGTTNTTVYDSVGRVAQTIDARGTVTANAYDVAGRRIAVTNAFGTAVQAVSSSSYDQNGNQITSTDADGHTTTNVYDALNRQVEVGYANGSKSSTGYDAAGRSIAQTNQDGIVTLFGYDGAGRLTFVTNAQNQVTQYQYDEAGNEIAQIDALGRTNTFTYDSIGRKIFHTLPYNPNVGSMEMEAFGYDLNGNQIGYTNYGGGYVVNQYDEMNRLTNCFSGNSYDAFQYIYTYTPSGQQAFIDIDNGNWLVISNIYDSRDRLMGKNMAWDRTGSPSSMLSESLSYGYDANGNVTGISSAFANGVNLAYAYDPLNRLTNVLSHGALSAAYSYDLAGNLKGMRYGNSVTNAYQYDSLNRLTNLVWYSNSLAAASFAYQLMPGGTRTNLVETINYQPPVSYQWSYDNLYRLTNETIGADNVAYAYDEVGNRTNRASGIMGLSSDCYDYDSYDRLMHTNGVAMSYNDDNDVNMTSASAQDYDAWGRLGNNQTIFYDEDGNRVDKDMSTETFYVVDANNPSGYAQVLEEFVTGPGGPVLNRVYNYGLGLISQQQFDTNTLLPSTLSYYGYDGHGSVRFLMGTNGTITDTYTYDAFGTLISSNGTTPNNYLYSGQQFDPDLGLYYNRARYLNTDVGRFTTMDTFEGNNDDPLSLHKYLYAEDDPVDGSDPTGNQDTMTELSVEDSEGTLASAGLPVISSVESYVGLSGGSSATRPLTQGEISLAEKIYGPNGLNIDYTKSGVNYGKFAFFQPQGREMTPKGVIYTGGVTVSDYSVAGSRPSTYDNSTLAFWDQRATFIHEMCHVWQYQHGVDVEAEGLVSRRYKYYGSDFGTKKFAAYNIEQQATIIEDYYSMLIGYHDDKYGAPVDVTDHQAVVALKAEYKKIIYEDLHAP